MVFNGEPTVDDVASYTHGMIQAIYKAYSLGPSCTPYEIAVGDMTKKMASCLPCTLFMVAAGYPPTHPSGQRRIVGPSIRAIQSGR